MEPSIDVRPGGFRSVMTRRNALRLIAGGAAASMVDATCIEPDQLSVTRRDIRCPRLPAALDGLRVALLADFHYRPDKDEELVEKTLHQIRADKTDLIALAGDFVDSSPRVLEPLLARLRNLEAAHGVFAVMGNHDGWNVSREEIKRSFEKTGISFLINRHSRITIRGETLAVAGTDFVWKGRPDPELTLRGIPAGMPVLALVHEPDYFDVMSARPEVMLQLSGHTHGGQCQVPLLGYAPVSVKYGRLYNYGEYTRGESKLFVTRGVGTTGPRVRFSCPPELAMLTLRSANTA